MHLMHFTMLGWCLRYSGDVLSRSVRTFHCFKASLTLWFYFLLACSKSRKTCDWLVAWGKAQELANRLLSSVLSVWTQILRELVYKALYCERAQQIQWVLIVTFKESTILKVSIYEELSLWICLYNNLILEELFSRILCCELRCAVT